MATSEPTVFVVDDDESVRRMVTRLLRSVGLGATAFASAEEFLDGYDPCQPGCLVLDVRMSGMSGLELRDKLVSKKISLPIIFVTGHGDVPMAVQCIQAGAVDFIEKPFREQALLDRIRQAIERDAWHREQEARHADVQNRLAHLTEKEREVLKLVVAGKANKQSAAELGVSIKAIEAHRARVMGKMDAGSAVELVRLVLTMGGR